MTVNLRRVSTLALAACLAIAGAAGCKGSAGTNGTNGTNGVSTGTLAGKVTIATTSPALPVVGATVALSPAIQGVSLTTSSTGDYSATVPAGVYTVTYSAANFATQTKTISVLATQTATQDVALVATAPVVVTVTATGTATPGATLNVSAVVTPLNGSTAQSVAWSADDAGVSFGSTSATSTTATLPNAAAFKARLFTALNESPITGATLRATVQDRFQVQAINHHDLEEAGKITLTVTATTNSGTYKGKAVVIATPAFGVQSGVAQVPIGIPVLVHGKAHASYSYTLTGPSGSTAALDDAASQNPMFTPDVPGTYTLAETGSTTSLTIYAGTWKGVIDAGATATALNATTGLGNPVGIADCTDCHRSGGSAPDNFTPWSKSGHASIFSQNVNAGGHYQKSCFECHTVGYNPGVTNAGIDEASDFNQMLAGIFTNNGSPVANINNWKTILTTYAKSAQMANIQCENCHGPQVVTGQSHSSAAVVATRAILDAGMCGQCHGEPTYHGRYQEWATSAHGDFSLAQGEGVATAGGVNANCGGCHSGQGAIEWFGQLQGGNPSRTLSTAIQTKLAGLTVDNVQPQTCSVCHDPHDPGTKSSLGTDAQPRITGNTPMLPSGFAAYGVGKGAMCIVCHNSRNGEKKDTAGNSLGFGLHEDGDPLWGTLSAYAAPHAACQGDVLMGRNAYLVTGIRGAHSNITNACVRCHMDLVTPAPEVGSASQTNHTFTANLTICSKCHGSFDGAGVQMSVSAELAALKAEIERVLMLYAPTGTTSASLTTFHGSPAVIWSGSTTATSLSTVVPFATNPVNAPILAKILWNYFLVSGDSSMGVHNPSFAHEVVFASTQQVKGITTAQ